MKKVIIALILVSAFSSCSKQPKCSDEDIKNEVMKMTAEKFLGANGSRFHHEWVYKKKSSEESTSEASLRLSEEYAIYYNELLDSIKLIGVRAISSDKETKQCSCLAQIQFHDNSKLDIEYSAQSTEDKDNPMYVEVRYPN